MENSKPGVTEGQKAVFSRVLNRDLFLFLLDLEVKRARRYQNFLSLMHLQIKQCSKSGNGWDFNTCYETLSDLLAVEMRETDILGSLGDNRLMVLLPYADVSVGDQAKARFEGNLKYYGFKSKGFDIVVDHICFPINGADTMDLIKKTLGTETV